MFLQLLGIRATFLFCGGAVINSQAFTCMNYEAALDDRIENHFIDYTCEAISKIRKMDFFELSDRHPHASLWMCTPKEFDPEILHETQKVIDKKGEGLLTFSPYLFIPYNAELHLKHPVYLTPEEVAGYKKQNLVPFTIPDFIQHSKNENLYLEAISLLEDKTVKVVISNKKLIITAVENNSNILIDRMIDLQCAFQSYVDSHRNKEKHISTSRSFKLGLYELCMEKSRKTEVI